MKTTIAAIRAESPCQSGWEKLLRHLGKTKAVDEPLSILTVLESNGLHDAIWCLRAVEGQDREIRLFAVWCARQVQHLMIDPRSLRSLDVFEAFANGLVTEGEMAAARDAARDAARVADAAAWTVVAVADDAAWSAAAWSAAAWSSDAARAAAWAAQAQELRRVCLAIEVGRDPYPYTPKETPQ